MQLSVRGRILPEARNPINRALIWLYRPVIAGVLRARMATILIALIGIEVEAVTRSGGSGSGSLTRRQPKARQEKLAVLGLTQVAGVRYYDGRDRAQPRDNLARRVELAHMRIACGEIAV